MEPHKRLELLDTLLEEIAQKRQSLESDLNVQNLAQGKHQQTVQDTSTPQLQQTLQAELEWWEKAQQGIAIAYNAFERLEQSERQRGNLARRAGR
jgi:hypothetical protein